MAANGATGASDNAADPAYSGGWTNGSNGGAGFGPWSQMLSIANITNDGFFVDTSSDNGSNPSGDIDTSGKSWGLYANGHDQVYNALAEGYRPYTGGALVVGQTVTLKIDTGLIDSGAPGMVGFTLLNQDPASGNNAFAALPSDAVRFSFVFVGGDTNYVIKLGNLTSFNVTTIDTGVPYTNDGVSVAFTLQSNDTFSVSVNGGAPITGSLGGTTNQLINGISVFNYAAGASTGVGPGYNSFFNSLAVSAASSNPPPPAVVTLSLDNAADPAYTNGWNNGSNGGYGWAGGWVLNAQASNSGFFAQSSTNNGHGNINTPPSGGQSWGMYAGPGGGACAARFLQFPLSAGQSLALDMDNGLIDTGSAASVGFSLLDDEPNSAPGTAFGFSFTGGDSTYLYTDGTPPFTHDSGIPFTSLGLHVVLTVTGPTNYSAIITSLGTGSNTVIAGALSGTAQALQYIDQLSFCNNHAGSGPDHDAYFNGLAIVTPPANTPPPPGAVLAADNADDPTYSGGWANGENGGFGWGGGWALSVSGPTNATGGEFISTSESNGFIDGNIDIGGRAWGLWSNGGGTTMATRPFAQTLGVGQSFAIDLDNGFVNSGSEVGFDLTGGGLQFIFGFWGGNTNYMINMPNEFGGANYTDTGVPFTSKGLHVVIAIGADASGFITYTCSLTPHDSAETIVSGYVRAAAGGITTVPVFNTVELLNNNAGVGPLYDVFFNHLAITAPPCGYSINPTNASYAAAGGSGSVTVTASNGCSWTAASNAGWVSITSGAGGSGNGTANYTVAINSNTVARSGTLTIAGLTFTVSQNSGDSVGDGIPDWWRQAYFGGNGATTNIPGSCAACDTDGTGQNNLFKYTAGLDPTNPASVFVLQVVPPIGQPIWQNLLLNPEVAGRTYTALVSTDLVNGVWAPLATYTGPVTNNGNQVTITDTNAVQAQKFYRVQISQP